MYKYSYEFKKKVVISYLNGEGGFRFIAEKYDIKKVTALFAEIYSER